MLFHTSFPKSTGQTPSKSVEDNLHPVNDSIRGGRYRLVLGRGFPVSEESESGFVECVVMFGNDGPH